MPLPHLGVLPLSLFQTGRPILTVFSVHFGELSSSFPHKGPCKKHYCLFAQCRVSNASTSTVLAWKTHTTVSSFLHECWGLNLVPHAYAESILQTEPSSSPLEFYVIYGPRYVYWLMPTALYTWLLLFQTLLIKIPHIQYLQFFFLSHCVLEWGS